MSTGAIFGPRTSNLYTSNSMLAAIGRSNARMLQVQQALSSGTSITRASDDPVKAAAILALRANIDRSTQRSRNIDHADAAISAADQSLADVTDVARDAKQVALGQLSSTAGATDRHAQSVVIQGLLASLLTTANSRGVAGAIFGGSRPEASPFAGAGAAIQYLSEGDGIASDLGFAADVPLTMAPPGGMGSVSVRYGGTVDFAPTLSLKSMLADTTGARGLAVATGTAAFSFNSGAPVSVDLAGAATINDVANRLTGAIRAFESQNSVTVLGPGGITVSGRHLNVDVSSASGPSTTLTFTDGAGGTTASDLGLADSAGLTFTPTAGAGLDLTPRLTLQTPLASCAGLTLPLGSLRVSNNGASAIVDLSGASTVEDVRNLIQTAAPGTRVAINAAGTGLEVASDMSAGRRGALAISEVVGGGGAAAALGIRTFSRERATSDFNFGAGVSIVNGAVNPTTGLPDPTRDIDFAITLGNAGGTVITVDLRPQDTTNVGAVIDRINAEAATQLAALGMPLSSLVASVSELGNGITLTQDSSFAGAVRVEQRNNSGAAADLGLLGATFDSGSASLVAEDRCRIRVDGLFSDLVDLRDALTGNDSAGIGFAASSLDDTLERLTQSRGVVGAMSKRVTDAGQREEDRRVVAEQARSTLQDTDFAAAATRLSLLQTQLQAGLQAAAATASRTLLDFLSA